MNKTEKNWSPGTPATCPVSDLVMPDMTGDVLAEERIKINPELPVIICTGHREMLDKTDTTKIRDILIKPVSRNDLA